MLDVSKVTQKTSIGTGKITPMKTPETPVMPHDEVEIGTVKHEQAGVKKQWLVLNYLAADCNLQSYQMAQIDDQEVIGSDANTHIVAQIDRGSHPNSSVKPVWKDCQRYYIKHDETPKTIKSDKLEDMGPINMSKPEVLRDFIVWGMKNFPADHVIVLLNDHGGGISGAMADDSQGGFMSVPELGRAFKEAKEITGQDVDIACYDACLMATTEVGYEHKDNVKILLASEETEGGLGISYKPIFGEKVNEGLKFLQENLSNRITVTPKELAKKFVEVNQAHPNDIPTFSAADLTKMDALKDKLDVVADLFLSKEFMDQKYEIIRAINAAQEFDGAKDQIGALGNVIEAINSGKVKDPDGKLKKACVDANDFATKEVVFANEHSSDYPGAYGLTIATSVGYNYGDLAFGKDSKWGTAMEALYGRGVLDQPIPKTWSDGSLRPGPRHD